MKKSLLLIFLLTFYISSSVTAKDYFSTELDPVWNDDFIDFIDTFDPVSLVEIEDGYNVLRFSCIETMTISYMIKITWSDETHKAEIMVDNSPVKHKTINISRTLIDDIQNLLNNHNFYSQESRLQSYGRDGTYYLVEANLAGSYKVIARYGTNGIIGKLKKLLLNNVCTQNDIFSMGKATWCIVDWIEE